MSEKKGPDRGGIPAFSDGPENDPKISQDIEGLLDSLEKERQARKEDRMVFLLIGVILFDVAVFPAFPTFGGPVVLLVLELIILIFIAHRMGIREVVQILDRVLTRVSGGLGKE